MQNTQNTLKSQQARKTRKDRKDQPAQSSQINEKAINAFMKRTTPKKPVQTQIPPVSNLDFFRKPKNMIEKQDIQYSRYTFNIVDVIKSYFEFKQYQEYDDMCSDLDNLRSDCSVSGFIRKWGNGNYYPSDCDSD